MASRRMAWGLEWEWGIVGFVLRGELADERLGVYNLFQLMIYTDEPERGCGYVQKGRPARTKRRG